MDNDSVNLSQNDDSNISYEDDLYNYHEEELNRIASETSYLISSHPIDINLDNTNDNLAISQYNDTLYSRLTTTKREKIPSISFSDNISHNIDVVRQKIFNLPSHSTVAFSSPLHSYNNEDTTISNIATILPTESKYSYNEWPVIDTELFNDAKQSYDEIFEVFSYPPRVYKINCIKEKVWAYNQYYYNEYLSKTNQENLLEEEEDFNYHHIYNSNYLSSPKIQPNNNTDNEEYYYNLIENNINKNNEFLQEVDESSSTYYSESDDFSSSLNNSSSFYDKGKSSSQNLLINLREEIDPQFNEDENELLNIKEDYENDYLKEKNSLLKKLNEGKKYLNPFLLNYYGEKLWYEKLKKLKKLRVIDEVYNEEGNLINYNEYKENKKEIKYRLKLQEDYQNFLQLEIQRRIYNPTLIEEIENILYDMIECLVKADENNSNVANSINYNNLLSVIHPASINSSLKSLKKTKNLSTSKKNESYYITDLPVVRVHITSNLLCLPPELSNYTLLIHEAERKFTDVLLTLINSNLKKSKVTETSSIVVSSTEQIDLKNSLIKKSTSTSPNIDENYEQSFFNSDKIISRMKEIFNFNLNSTSLFNNNKNEVTQIPDFIIKSFRQLLHDIINPFMLKPSQYYLYTLINETPNFLTKPSDELTIFINYIFNTNKKSNLLNYDEYKKDFLSKLNKKSNTKSLFLSKFYKNNSNIENTNQNLLNNIEFKKFLTLLYNFLLNFFLSLKKLIKISKLMNKYSENTDIISNNSNFNKITEDNPSSYLTKNEFNIYNKSELSLINAEDAKIFSSLQFFKNKPAYWNLPKITLPNLIVLVKDTLKNIELEKNQIQMIDLNSPINLPDDRSIREVEDIADDFYQDDDEKSFFSTSTYYDINNQNQNQNLNQNNPYNKVKINPLASFLNMKIPIQLPDVISLDLIIQKRFPLPYYYRPEINYQKKFNIVTLKTYEKIKPYVNKYFVDKKKVKINDNNFYLNKNHPYNKINSIPNYSLLNSNLNLDEFDQENYITPPENIIFIDGKFYPVEYSQLEEYIDYLIILKKQVYPSDLYLYPYDYVQKLIEYKNYELFLEENHDESVRQQIKPVQKPTLPKFIYDNSERKKFESDLIMELSIASCLPADCFSINNIRRLELNSIDNILLSKKKYENILNSINSLMKNEMDVVLNHLDDVLKELECNNEEIKIKYYETFENLDNTPKPKDNDIEEEDENIEEDIDEEENEEEYQLTPTTLEILDSLGIDKKDLIIRMEVESILNDIANILEQIEYEDKLFEEDIKVSQQFKQYTPRDVSIIFEEASNIQEKSLESLETGSLELYNKEQEKLERIRNEMLNYTIPTKESLRISTSEQLSIRDNFVPNNSLVTNEDGSIVSEKDSILSGKQSINVEKESITSGKASELKKSDESISSTIASKRDDSRILPYEMIDKAEAELIIKNSKSQPIYTMRQDNLFKGVNNEDHWQYKYFNIKENLQYQKNLKFRRLNKIREYYNRIKIFKKDKFKSMTNLNNLVANIKLKKENSFYSIKNSIFYDLIQKQQENEKLKLQIENLPDNIIDLINSKIVNFFFSFYNYFDNYLTYFSTNSSSFLTSMSFSSTLPPSTSYLMNKSFSLNNSNLFVLNKFLKFFKEVRILINLVKQKLNNYYYYNFKKGKLKNLPKKYFYHDKVDEFLIENKNLEIYQTTDLVGKEENNSIISAAEDERLKKVIDLVSQMEKHVEDHIKSNYNLSKDEVDKLYFNESKNNSDINNLKNDEISPSYISLLRNSNEFENYPIEIVDLLDQMCETIAKQFNDFDVSSPSPNTLVTQDISSKTNKNIFEAPAIKSILEITNHFDFNKKVKKLDYYKLFYNVNINVLIKESNKDSLLGLKNLKSEDIGDFLQLQMYEPLSLLNNGEITSHIISINYNKNYVIKKMFKKWTSYWIYIIHPTYFNYSTKKRKKMQFHGDESDYEEDENEKNKNLIRIYEDEFHDMQDDHRNQLEIINQFPNQASINSVYNPTTNILPSLTPAALQLHGINVDNPLQYMSEKSRNLFLNLNASDRKNDTDTETESEKHSEYENSSDSDSEAEFKKKLNANKNKDFLASLMSNSVSSFDPLESMTTQTTSASSNFITKRKAYGNQNNSDLNLQFKNRYTSSSAPLLYLLSYEYEEKIDLKLINYKSNKSEGDTDVKLKDLKKIHSHYKIKSKKLEKVLNKIKNSKNSLDMMLTYKQYNLFKEVQQIFRAYRVMKIKYNQYLKKKKQLEDNLKKKLIQKRREEKIIKKLFFPAQYGGILSKIDEDSDEIELENQILENNTKNIITKVTTEQYKEWIDEIKQEDRERLVLKRINMKKLKMQLKVEKEIRKRYNSTKKWFLSSFIAAYDLYRPKLTHGINNVIDKNASKLQELSSFYKEPTLDSFALLYPNFVNGISNFFLYSHDIIELKESIEKEAKKYENDMERAKELERVDEKLYIDDTIKRNLFAKLKEIKKNLISEEKNTKKLFDFLWVIQQEQLIALNFSMNPQLQQLNGIQNLNANTNGNGTGTPRRNHSRSIAHSFSKKSFSSSQPETPHRNKSIKIQNDNSQDFSIDQQNKVPDINFSNILEYEETDETNRYLSKSFLLSFFDTIIGGLQNENIQLSLENLVIQSGNKELKSKFNLSNSNLNNNLNLLRGSRRRSSSKTPKKFFSNSRNVSVNSPINSFLSNTSNSISLKNSMLLNKKQSRGESINLFENAIKNFSNEFRSKSGSIFDKIRTQSIDKVRASSPSFDKLRTSSPSFDKVRSSSPLDFKTSGTPSKDNSPLTTSRKTDENAGRIRLASNLDNDDLLSQVSELSHLVESSSKKSKNSFGGGETFNKLNSPTATLTPKFMPIQKSGRQSFLDFNTNLNFMQLRRNFANASKSSGPSPAPRLSSKVFTFKSIDASESSEVSTKRKNSQSTQSQHSDDQVLYYDPNYNNIIQSIISSSNIISSNQLLNNPQAMGYINKMINLMPFETFLTSDDWDAFRDIRFLNIISSSFPLFFWCIDNMPTSNPDGFNKEELVLFSTVLVEVFEIVQNTVHTLDYAHFQSDTLHSYVSPFRRKFFKTPSYEIQALKIYENALLELNNANNNEDSIVESKDIEVTEKEDDQYKLQKVQEESEKEYAWFMAHPHQFIMPHYNEYEVTVDTINDSNIYALESNNVKEANNISTMILGGAFCIVCQQRIYEYWLFKFKRSEIQWKEKIEYHLEKKIEKFEDEIKKEVELDLNSLLRKRAIIEVDFSLSNVPFYQPRTPIESVIDVYIQCALHEGKIPAKYIEDNLNAMILLKSYKNFNEKAYHSLVKSKVNRLSQSNTILIRSDSSVSLESLSTTSEVVIENEDDFLTRLWYEELNVIKKELLRKKMYCFKDGNGVSIFPLKPDLQVSNKMVLLTNFDGAFNKSIPFSSLQTLNPMEIFSLKIRVFHRNQEGERELFLGMVEINQSTLLNPKRGIRTYYLRPDNEIINGSFTYEIGGSIALHVHLIIPEKIREEINELKEKKKSNEFHLGSFLIKHLPYIKWKISIKKLNKLNNIGTDFSQFSPNPYCEVSYKGLAMDSNNSPVILPKYSLIHVTSTQFNSNGVNFEEINNKSNADENKINKYSGSIFTLPPVFSSNVIYFRGISANEPLLSGGFVTKEAQDHFVDILNKETNLNNAESLIDNNHENLITSTLTSPSAKEMSSKNNSYGHHQQITHSHELVDIQKTRENKKYFELFSIHYKIRKKVYYYLFKMEEHERNLMAQEEICTKEFEWFYKLKKYEEEVREQEINLNNFQKIKSNIVSPSLIFSRLRFVMGESLNTNLVQEDLIVKNLERKLEIEDEKLKKFDREKFERLYCLYLINNRISFDDGLKNSYYNKIIDIIDKDKVLVNKLLKSKNNDPNSSSTNNNLLYVSSYNAKLKKQSNNLLKFLCQDPATNKLFYVFYLPIFDMTKEKKLQELVLKLMNNSNESLVKIVNFSIHSIQTFNSYGYLSTFNRIGVIILEYFNNSITLLQFLLKNWNKVTNDDFRLFLLQLAKSLQFIHSNQILHKNLAPHSVFVSFNKNMIDQSKIANETFSNSSPSPSGNIKIEEKKDLNQIVSKYSSSTPMIRKSCLNRPQRVFNSLKKSTTESILELKEEADEEDNENNLEKIKDYKKKLYENKTESNYNTIGHTHVIKLTDYYFFYNPNDVCSSSPISSTSSNWGYKPTSPPESLSNDPITMKGDVYAFGRCAYYWATKGQYPKVNDIGNNEEFYKNIRSSIPAKWDDWLISLLRLCLNKEPNRRATMQEIVNFLTRASTFTKNKNK